MAPGDSSPAAGGAEKTAALSAVAAAAALRSEGALWPTLEEALLTGASPEELERAIREAARVAEAAVRADGLRTLREVLARHGAKERWGVTDA